MKYRSASKQGSTRNGWWEVGVSYDARIYSFNIDVTFVRDHGKLDGFDVRFSLLGGDSFVRWTRNLPGG